MSRTPIWQAIAADLRDEFGKAQYRAGDKLPTEAALAARFGVNRHTVRRALRAMAEEGLVHSRRGAGVFVAMAPTEYPIGRRVRFHQNVRAAGRVPAKDILLTETRAGNARECAALQLAPGAPVQVCEGLSLADGQPIALFRSVFPARRFPDLLEDVVSTGSVTEALARGGVADYTRASTRFDARPATATQALHLRIAEGDPILRTTNLNVDTERVPVEFGYTWFCGDRVTLTMSDLEAPASAGVVPPLS